MHAHLKMLTATETKDFLLKHATKIPTNLSQQAQTLIYFHDEDNYTFTLPFPWCDTISTVDRLKLGHNSMSVVLFSSLHTWPASGSGVSSSLLRLQHWPRESTHSKTREICPGDEKIDCFPSVV